MTYILLGSVSVWLLGKIIFLFSMSLLFCCCASGGKGVAVCLFVFCLTQSSAQGNLASSRYSSENLLPCFIAKFCSTQI